MLIGRRDRHNCTALGRTDVAFVLYKGEDLGKLFPLRFLRPVLGNLEWRQGVVLTAGRFPVAVLCGDFFLLRLFVQDDSAVDIDNIHLFAPLYQMCSNEITALPITTRPFYEIGFMYLTKLFPCLSS